MITSCPGKLGGIMGGPDTEEGVLYGSFVVAPMGDVALILLVGEGDEVSGKLHEIDNRAFTWMIVDAKNLARFRKRRKTSPVKSQSEVRSGAFNWKAPKGGRWYLVLDASKASEAREVMVDIRRSTRGKVRKDGKAPS